MADHTPEEQAAALVLAWSNSTEETGMDLIPLAAEMIRAHGRAERLKALREAYLYFPRTEGNDEAHARLRRLIEGAERE